LTAAKRPHFDHNEDEGRVEESGVSALREKRWHGGGFNTALARFAQSLPRIIAASPELFFLIACLFVWQVTATAVKPAALGLALLLTLLLLAYGYRVLGKTKWICRIGWVVPRRGFWIYSFLAGTAVAAGIWSYVRIFHLSLGRVPPPHRVLLASASGPMIEEMLFRGILFWLILEFLRRRGAPRLAAVCATVVLTAILFALSHNDRNLPRLLATIATGVSFGWMRAQSGSTAAAALMHAVYNFALSSMATLQ
jgi:membrane protease YdiL (CAAX protease family)